MTRLMLSLTVAVGRLAEALGEKRGLNGETTDPHWRWKAEEALDKADDMIHKLRWHIEGVTT